MDIKELKQKLETGGELSPEELKILFTQMNEELTDLKERDPQRYIELVKELTEMMQELTEIIKK